MSDGTESDLRYEHNTTSARRGFSEDSLVEQPAIQAFQWLGWEVANLYNEWAGGKSTEGRETQHDVILV